MVVEETTKGSILCQGPGRNFFSIFPKQFLLKIAQYLYLHLQSSLQVGMYAAKTQCPQAGESENDPLTTTFNDTDEP
jgi:hypothetical protein